MTLATPADAEATARVFLEEIDKGDSLYSHTLNAYANGISWANSKMAETQREPLYCPPPNVAFTDDQIVQILRRYLSERPAVAEAPAGLAMLMALEATFPCNEARQSDGSRF
jgi:hypothetical protein